MLKVARPEIETRVMQSLDMIGIPDKANSYPSELSGGQQQRVALARALVTRPAVLLLDEPLGALDLKMRRRMQAELKKLQREVGITFVYVTHDQEEALALSDEIVVMQDGVIVQRATLRKSTGVRYRPMSPISSARPTFCAARRLAAASSRSAPNMCASRRPMPWRHLPSPARSRTRGSWGRCTGSSSPSPTARS